MVKTYGEAARLYLVFYGDSGGGGGGTCNTHSHARSPGRCSRTTNGVLKVDGEVGNRKAYDPRS